MKSLSTQQKEYMLMKGLAIDMHRSNLIDQWYPHKGWTQRALIFRYITLMRKEINFNTNPHRQFNPNHPIYLSKIWFLNSNYGSYFNLYIYSYFCFFIHSYFLYYILFSVYYYHCTIHNPNNHHHYPHIIYATTKKSNWGHHQHD